MSGEELKQQIKGAGLSLKEVADALNIRPQTLQNKLKVKSVKTDFLIDIKAIINKKLDGNEKTIVQHGNIFAAEKIDKPTLNIDQGVDYAVLAKENEMLKEEISYLRSILSGVLTDRNK